MKNYKQITEAINRGIKFALSDLEDDEELSSISKQKTGEIESLNGRVQYQKYQAQKNLSQKAFIYELLKRLPGVDKKLFSPFGFVNYKVTRNDNDWPYLVSTNTKMAERTLEKYEQIFDKVGWTTINGTHTLDPLLWILSDRYFKNYHRSRIYKDMQKPRGETAYSYFCKDNKWWLESFKGKYIECHDALIKLAKAHKNLNEEVEVMFINQVSLSNDGAFIAIFYQWLDDEKRDYRYCIDIFSTNKLVDDEIGINVDEYKDVKSNQTNFKNYLNKTIIKKFGDLVFSRLLVPDNINNHAAFIYEIRNNEDFGWQTKTYWKAKEAYDLLRKCMPYNDVTYNLGTFMFFSIHHNYYIEDNYHGSNSIYENLIYKSKKPYVVISSQSGEYLVAFYSNYIDYRKYALTYAIIDNRDYKLMPKEFLKEIEYNEITL